VWQVVVGYNVLGWTVGTVSAVWIGLTATPSRRWGMYCLPPLSPLPPAAAVMFSVNLLVYAITYVFLGLTAREIRRVTQRWAPSD
jgi:hypothetical protein